MKQVKLHDKVFEESISAEQIQAALDRLGEQINQDMVDENVTFLAVLNGSFMVAADLMKRIRFNSLITFVKVASYSGLSSTGRIQQLIGLDANISGQTVVIIEDIIDSGQTIEKICDLLKKQQPKRIVIATLLYKPQAYVKDIPIDYIGLEIPNDFVVGYGLDYDGYGRNLDAIYTLKS